jgi:excisionase family DNA binding protein
MPKKAERRVPLPAGLLPLLSQKELETYYNVSDFTVLRWIEKGLPVEPFGGRGRRFDLTAVKAWMADHEQDLAVTA